MKLINEVNEGTKDGQLLRDISFEEKLFMP